MFLMRVGITEILVCLALIVGLIVIPAVIYWKCQRLGRRD